MPLLAQRQRTGDIMTAGLSDRRSGKTQRQAPLVSTIGICGHADEMILDPLGLFTRAHTSCGDIARLQFGPQTAHVLVHPDHFRHVLQSRQRIYCRSEETPDHVRVILGRGLLTANDENWFRQRQRLAPFFRPKKLVAHESIIKDCIDDLLERWNDVARRRTVVDLHDEMVRVTLRMSGQTLLGDDMEEWIDDVIHATAAFHNFGAKGYAKRSPGDPSKSLSLQESRRLFEDIICHMVDRRPPARDGEPDLFSAIIEGHGGEVAAKRSRQFHDEIITLLMASHETTASALTFGLIMLIRHPEFLRRLRDEAEPVLAGWQEGRDNASSLSYARTVMHETLRLFPPAWMIDRHCREDDEIDGFFVPKDSMVFLVPYLTHRHPDFWQEPDHFNPGRFEAREIAKRPRHAFFPFGTGPRVCIGASLAMKMGSLTLASITDRFDLSLARDEPIDLSMSFTLRPRGAVPMTAHLRPPS